MNLLDINIQYRVIIGISAMVILFSSFLVAFISNQRKKLQYHKNLQAIHEQQQQALMQQNLQLEDRVKERTNEISAQKETLQVALTDLKLSQMHLVQKEKMASLGELAAGIAHEIQNPLNFVNNFSEINIELLQEMKELIAAENRNDNKEEIDMLFDDVMANLQKITQHGKRADNIVKNLLQHSRSNSGESILSDVNLLAEEYLKLSYHGFRSKDKLVHVVIESVFDAAIENINIVPQEIGRVFMNIFNNAFYSVLDKAKKNIEGYVPMVKVTTCLQDDKVKIIIRDNGLGIAAKYIDKIFQPFFTKKPTGEGTGLGLSLSYEIIKAHRGQLKVDAVEGAYAEFTIELLNE